jgi:hypothetical protein
MNDATTLVGLFREAVAAMDAGRQEALGRLLAAHPRLVHERLDEPGPWLTDRAAVQGLFQRPYLLWFVAEDPVRNGTLPANIADIARTIVQAAQREHVASLREQLDHALRLVCWSEIARECGVQIELIDVLVDAGASPDGRWVYEGRYGTHRPCGACSPSGWTRIPSAGGTSRTARHCITRHGRQTSRR